MATFATYSWAGLDSSDATVTTTGTLGSGVIFLDPSSTIATSSSSTDNDTIGTAFFDKSNHRMTINNGSRWVGVDYSTREVGSTATISYVTSGDGLIVSPPQIHMDKSKIIKQEVKRIMRKNLLIKLGSTRQKPLNTKVSAQEMKARMTLRDSLSEKEWRRYLANGFVIIKGDSNKFYQVFNDQSHIKVYSKGKLTDEICIHSEECPPTDHILNMMALIQYDENLIWTKGVGNVYKKNPSSSNNIAVEAEMMRTFIASGADVPVELKAKAKEKNNLRLIEKYKQLKVA